MRITSNIYQRIHALCKEDFREMRSELKRCSSYNEVLAGRGKDLSSEEKTKLKRIFGKHGVLIADDEEVITAIYVTMGRSAESR